VHTNTVDCFYRETLSGTNGAFRFEDVSGGDGILYLVNNPRGILFASPGRLQRVPEVSPIDPSRHAFIGTDRNDAQVAVAVPASTEPTRIIDIGLELGGCIEITPSAPVAPVDLMTFAPLYWKGKLAWGHRDVTAQRPFVFRGLLTSQGPVVFEGLVRFWTTNGLSQGASFALRWTLGGVNLAPQEKRTLEVAIPFPDLGQESITGRVAVGVVDYAVANRDTLNRAGYYVGPDAELAFERFPAPVMISVWRPDGNWILETHLRDTGYYAMPGLANGTYLFQATYHRLKQVADFSSGEIRRDPLEGHIKGRVMELGIQGRVPVNIRFPDPMPEEAKRVSEGKYSTLVEYETGQ
jgi:hypothetical protein